MVSRILKICGPHIRKTIASIIKNAEVWDYISHANYHIKWPRNLKKTRRVLDINILSKKLKLQTYFFELILYECILPYFTHSCTLITQHWTTTATSSTPIWLQITVFPATSWKWRIPYFQWWLRSPAQLLVCSASHHFMPHCSIICCMVHVTFKVNMYTTIRKISKAKL